MKKRNPEHICATHGKKKTFGMKAIINGVLSLAYFEGEKIVSYEPWEDINRQMYQDPCPTFELDF